MSGPKYIEFDVDCSDDERIAIIEALNRINARGVSYRGRGDIRVRVEDYAGISVARLKEIIAATKREVAERNEQQRREELARAQEEERRRSEEAARALEAEAKKHISMIDTAIRDCESQLSRLKGARTATRQITSVSAEGLCKDIEERIKALKRTREEMEREITGKRGAIASYISGISSHGTIESLNSAMSSRPALYLKTSYDASIRREILEEIDRCTKVFIAFRDYLTRIETGLGGKGDTGALLRKINATLEAHPFVTVDDISECIELLRKHCEEYAGAHREEEMRKMASFIEQLSASIEKIRVSVDGTVKIGTGIDYGKLISAESDTARRSAEKTRAYEFMAPEKKRALADLTREIERLAGGTADARSEAQIRACRAKIEELVAACKRDEDAWQEFSTYKKKLELLKRTVSEYIDVEEIIFSPAKAAECIKRIKDEVERVEAEAAVVKRNCRAIQLIASLTNKENGEAGTYELMCDEVLPDNTRRLRFVKPGAFGVFYEYIVDLNGGAHRDIRGLTVGGKPIISEAELIKRKHTDCSDMEAMARDMSEMGSGIRWREERSPEESSSTADFPELEEALIEDYLMSVIPDWASGYSEYILAEVKDGRSYEDVIREVEISVREGRSIGGSVGHGNKRTVD